MVVQICVVVPIFMTGIHDQMLYLQRHTATCTVTHCNALQRTATHCNALQTLLQSTIVCNTLQHTATHCDTLWHAMTHCNALCCTVKQCNTLHYTAAHCTTLQHTAAHCNTLQHTATHCNTLQHTATHPYMATHGNTRQHTATHCNILHYQNAPTHTLMMEGPMMPRSNTTQHAATRCTIEINLCAPAWWRGQWRRGATRVQTMISGTTADTKNRADSNVAKNTGRPRGTLEILDMCTYVNIYTYTCWHMGIWCVCTHIHMNTCAC